MQNEAEERFEDSGMRVLSRVGGNTLLRIPLLDVEARIGEEEELLAALARLCIAGNLSADRTPVHAQASSDRKALQRHAPLREGGRAADCG